MAVSTAPDLSGSGRVDMLPCPVAASRAAVATGVSGLIDTRHVSDTWKRGSLSFIFTHPPKASKKKKKEKKLLLLLLFHRTCYRYYSIYLLPILLYINVTGITIYSCYRYCYIYLLPVLLYTPVTGIAIYTCNRYYYIYVLPVLLYIPDTGITIYTCYRYYYMYQLPVLLYVFDGYLHELRCDECNGSKCSCSRRKSLFRCFYIILCHTIRRTGGASKQANGLSTAIIRTSIFIRSVEYAGCDCHWYWLYFHSLYL